MNHPSSLRLVVALHDACSWKIKVRQGLIKVIEPESLLIVIMVENRKDMPVHDREQLWLIVNDGYRVIPRIARVVPVYFTLRIRTIKPPF